MDEIKNVTTDIVEETTKEIVPATSSNSLVELIVKVGVGLGTTALVIGGVWLFNKHQAKKAARLEREREQDEVAEAINNIYGEDEPIQPEYAPDED